MLGPGVVAVGVGGQSAPASVEQLATHLLDGGYAGNVLAVPITHRALQRAAHGMGQHSDECTFDTICTVIDTGIVLMTPALAFTLTALTMTLRGGEVRVSRPRPFLEAAAQALRIDQMTVVDTGIDSLTSARGQWDDGGNALAVGNRTIVCDERNVETNARLADEGFEVIAVPCGELGGVRGGPRCMCVPLLRDPAVVFDDRLASTDVGQAAAASPAPRLPRPAEPAVPPQAAASDAERVSRRGELAPLR
jgi:arginine deiminase